MGALGAREEALRSVSPEPKEKPVLDNFLEEASHGSCSGANSAKTESAVPFPAARGHPGRPSPPSAMGSAAKGQHRFCAGGKFKDRLVKEPRRNTLSVRVTRPVRCAL